MSKINIRSPFYVTYNTAGLESFRIELYVWSGDSTSRPSVPVYNLTTSAIDDYATIEISELIRDYVNTSFNGTYTSSALWVEYIRYKTVNGVESLVSLFPTLNGAYDGYGYFSDGVNPQNRNALLVSSPTIYKMKDEVLTLPYNIGLNLSVNFESNASTTITYSIDLIGSSSVSGIFLQDNDLFSSGVTLPSIGGTIFFNGVSTDTAIVTSLDSANSRVFFTGGLNTVGSKVSYSFEVASNPTSFDNTDSTNESSDIIRYFSSTDTDRVLSTTDSVTTIYDVVEIEECRNTPYKLTFVNKFGALEDIWFYGASREITSTTKDDYKSNIVSAGSYSINEHQRKILNKNGVDSMVINSNFYPEEHNETFKQLLLSEKVWITYKTKVLPIQITSNTISFKNRLNDKLINYEINIEFSNNTINNIR